MNHPRRPDDERIEQEIMAAANILKLYGTNQPKKTYEEGLIEGLSWVLGGTEPQQVTQ